MGILAVFFSIFGWICMGIGVATLLKALPLLRSELTWTVWFGLSALLFLASIAANMGGRRRGGGGGEEF
jgi:hypothetical protein